MIQYLYSMY